MITTCDAEDKSEIDRMYFQSKEDMAETLNTLAKTKDPNIGYIDIHMPVPLLQVNVLKIVFRIVMSTHISKTALLCRIQLFLLIFACFTNTALLLYVSACHDRENDNL